MVVVPAVMVLLGRWNWYLPSWLDWMPELHVEGDTELGSFAPETTAPVAV